MPLKKASKGDPARFMNEVVIPFTGKECLIWPFTRPGWGYGTIRQGSVKRYVHRLVCEAVNGASPSKKHHAAHACGNGHLGCVNPKHLEWKTPTGNAADRLVHGTIARGEKNGGAKLTVEQVTEILMTRPGEHVAVERFGISRSQYFSILRRSTWGHVNVD